MLLFDFRIIPVLEIIDQLLFEAMQISNREFNDRL